MNLDFHPRKRMQGCWMWGMVLGMALAIALVLLTAGAADVEFADQPDVKSSSLSMYYGNSVYDWEFANMVKMWIADAGCDNMLFFFNQCFGGGMIDDLAVTLGGTADIGLLAAARYDEPAWGLKDAFVGTASSAKLGFDRPRGYYSFALGGELARIGTNAATAEEMAVNAAENDFARDGSHGWWGSPSHTKVEHPQAAFVGDGKDLKIGRHADGTEASKVYVVLFAGEVDKATANDLEQAFNIFHVKHAIPRDRIIVLADDGPHNKMTSGAFAPYYATGKGSRQALFDTIRGLRDKLDADSQFIFWANGHGNDEDTHLALDIVLTDQAAVPIPTRDPKTGEYTSSSWVASPTFFKDAVSGGAANPYISLLVDPAFDLTYQNDLALYLNGLKLVREVTEEIHALDDQPDLDAYEFIYYFRVEDLLPENVLEAGWEDPETFQPYTIHGLQVSTGAIPRGESTPPEPEASGPPKVLIALPESYLPEELDRVMEDFYQWGYDLGVATPGNPPQVRQDVGVPAQGLEFFPLRQASMEGYDGLLFLGPGWYEDWAVHVLQGVDPPGYTEDASRLVGEAIAQDSVLGGIGPGAYPLILSGELPDRTKASIYDCPEYRIICQMFGIDAVVSDDSAPPSSPMYGSPAVTLKDTLNGAVMLTTSIPTTRYAPDWGADLVNHYDEDYDEFFYEWTAVLPVVDEYSR